VSAYRVRYLHHREVLSVTAQESLLRAPLSAQMSFRVVNGILAVSTISMMNNEMDVSMRTGLDENIPAQGHS